MNDLSMQGDAAAPERALADMILAVEGVLQEARQAHTTEPPALANRLAVLQAEFDQNDDGRHGAGGARGRAGRGRRAGACCSAPHRAPRATACKALVAWA